MNLLPHRPDRDCPSRRDITRPDIYPLCPTFQELDSDQRRIPSNIIQTRCRCDNCVTHHRRRHRNMCTPVFRNLPVIRRVGCVHGVYEYMEFQEKVSVACVCMGKLELKKRRKQYTEKMPDDFTDHKTYSDTEKMADMFSADAVDTEFQEADTSAQNIPHPRTRFEQTEKMPENFESLDPERFSDTEHLAKISNSQAKSANPTKMADDFGVPHRHFDTEKMPE